MVVGGAVRAACGGQEKWGWAQRGERAENGGLSVLGGGAC